MAFAKGARQGGVQIFEDTAVVGLITRGNRVIGVETRQGAILADMVVLAAGMWTCRLAATIGVTVPLQAAEHFYLVTEPMQGLASGTPGIVSFEERAYYKEDAGKLLFGVFEATGRPWGCEGIPANFEFDSLPADPGNYEREIETAMRRIPRLAETGIKTFFIGPESFTPDGRYLIGRAPEKAGLFIAAGMNSSGIMSSPGVGRTVAQWLKDGEPPVDMHWAAPSRMQPFQRNRRYLHDRTIESLGIWANMPWPGRQMESARGVRRMPLYHEQKAAGAEFGERAGWEVPLWFRSSHSAASPGYRLGRQSWYPAAEREALATRDAVALYDQSAYAKFLVEGPDALGLLNRLSANNIDAPIGKVVYTPWLNDRGGIEADLTVTRLDENCFLVVTGFADQVTDLAWLRQHADGTVVSIADVTSGYGLLGVMGPRSRELLQGLSDTDLSNTALPFGYSKEIDLGYSTVRAARVTFVGELGYELMVAAEFCGYVHDLLTRAGEHVGLLKAGLFTLGACRVERGYRVMGLDIGPEYTPIDAGLAFAVAWDKPVDFNGRAAMEKARRAGPSINRLVQFCLDDASKAAPILMGREVVYRNGESVGSISSGAFGFRLQRSLGMGYVSHAAGVTKEWLAIGEFELDIAMKRHGVRASLQPFYDPDGSRTRM
jgi:4-methylaminobutanoate oxidase (formaldehyde-forming)